MAVSAPTRVPSLHHRQHGDACFVFGVVPANGPLDLGPVGFSADQVYGVIAEGMAALVQPWTPGALDPGNRSELEHHLRVYQGVLERALARCGTVLPVQFGTVFTGADGAAAEAAVRGWLHLQGGSLRVRMAELCGQQEYLVRLYSQKRTARERLLQPATGLRTGVTDRPGAGAGTQYLLQRKREVHTSQSLDQAAAKGDEQVQVVLQRYCRRWHRDPLGPASAGAWDLIGQYSCLVPAAAARELEQELLWTAGQSGLWCRVTGPWPPYSFV